MAANRFIARHGIDVNNQRVVNIVSDGNGFSAANKGFSENASNISNGTLPVSKGGLGVLNLNGLIKGNGTLPVTAASVNTVYIKPDGNTGTADKLTNPVTINGTVFNGASDVEIPVDYNKPYGKLPGDVIISKRFGKPVEDLTTGTIPIIYNIKSVNNSLIGSNISGEFSRSTDGINWTYSYIGWSGVKKVDFLNGVYIAVGSSAKLATSVNGTTWTTRTLPVTVDINSVAFGNNKYVAVGNSGKIIISDDSITWAEVQTSVFGTSAINNIFYYDNKFIVTAAGYKLGYSTDGTTWFNITVSNLTNNISDVVYNNGTYVLLTTTRYIFTSKDLINWVKIDTGIFEGLGTGVYYNDRYFFSTYKNGICYSRDLVTFKKPTTPLNVSSSSYILGLVIFNKHVYCYSTVPFKIVQAIRFKQNSFDTEEDSLIPLNGTSYFKSKYPTIFNEYSKNAVFYPMGTAWINLGTPYKDVLNNTSRVFFLNNKFISLGYNTHYISDDGLNWVSISFPVGFYPSCITYGNGVYVAVGNSGTIATSVDGINWTKNSTTNSFGSKSISSITYGNGIFVAGGTDGILITSVDGTNWESKVSGIPIGKNIYSIEFLNNQFIAVGNTDTVSVCSDSTGTTWVSRTNNIWGYCSAYGNGLYISGGSSGEVSVSSDNGVTWAKRNTNFGPNKHVYAIVFYAGKFIAAGIDGNMAASTDGINWTNIGSGLIYSDVLRIAISPYRLIASGADGNMSHSTSDYLFTVPVSSDGLKYVRY